MTGSSYFGQSPFGAVAVEAAAAAAAESVAPASWQWRRVDAVHTKTDDLIRTLNLRMPALGHLVTQLVALQAWINLVFDCAATGDGVTDDTAAIQAADALSVSTGRTVLARAGNYRVTESITLSGKWAMQAGAYFQPDSGDTVTIEGALWTDSIAVVDGASGDVDVTGAWTNLASDNYNQDPGNGPSRVWLPQANAIAADVAASVISGGGNTNNPNLIGYEEYRDRFNGTGAEDTFTTTFAVASAGDVRVRLIRTDKVRVTITSFCDITIVAGFAQVVYPQAGHFVNNAIGGSEGTDPFLLTTEQIEIVGITAVEVVGSASNYSGIYGGYDNVIQEGVMQHILGAHHRIAAGDHNTILGGSYGRIDAGTYCIILGGTANEISVSGTGSGILGGNGNTIDTLGPCWIMGGSANRAGGAFAFIGGGAGNVVTGNGAFVGGRVNIISGRDALVGGYGNTISNVYCFVAGLQNVVSGAYSGAMGRDNTVAGESAYAFGRSLTVSGESATASGRSNTASGIGTDAMGVDANARLPYGETRAGTFFAALGDAQTSMVPLRAVTTNATPTELNIAGTTRITIPTDTTWAFSCLIVARRTDADNESAGYKIEGVIDNNAGTTALVGAVTVTVLAEDTAAWDATATADNTNDALTFTVTGEAAKTIRWVGRLTLVEVSG